MPVLWLDVDDDQARRLLLVDNRTNDLAEYADDMLAQLLASFDGELAGTGFDAVDLDRLLAALEPDPLDTSSTPFDRSAEHDCPFCSARWVDTANGPQRL